MNRLLAWAGHGWLALPARWYLGFVFLLACQHKIAHPGAFALDVATYGILPLSLVNLMATTASAPRASTRRRSSAFSATMPA